MKSKDDFLNPKFRLNWKIKDSIEDVSKRNLFLYKISFLVTFLFVVLFAISFLYLYIISTDQHLKVYFQYFDSLTKKGFALPSFVDVWGTMIAAFALFAISLGLVALYKPIVTSGGNTKLKQLFYIVTLTIFIVSAFLLSALSQHHYGSYAEFVRLELSTEANPELTKALKSVGDTLIFDWKFQSTVWWVLFVQIIGIFSLIITLENATSKKEDTTGIEKYIHYNLKTSKSFSGSKIVEKMNRVFKPTTKNISVWALIVVVLVLLPNFIFTILISTSTTKMGAMIQWSYHLPNLLKDFSGVDQLYSHLLGDKYQPAYFSLNSLPIIMIGITFATSFFFLSILTRSEKQISDIVFVVQSIILGIEVVTLLIIMIFIKFEMNTLLSIWLDHGANFKTELQTILTVDFNKITELFHFDLVQHAIDTKTLEWLPRSGVIAETIISFSFVGAMFTGVGIGLVKNIKMHNEFYKLKKEAEEEYAY
ncbi:hypothetical protein [Williamsoniiplasma lucivorax]|uniref:Uncharacterized protein n=1 Tax=Williamsoniiplasma lucivorax TaxID=209274 RepID=A0A2S5RFC3_9MOLU|nr:hypothetical protein [Williamsoniiplasma lucivorax]PPE06036.1 hypothetical protein ELUCI_v1c03270 [Williamsoniiplasma lucivorax]